MNLMGVTIKNLYATFVTRTMAITSTMESTIGAALHGQELSYCPAVILNDEIISDNRRGNR